MGRESSLPRGVRIIRGGKGIQIEYTFEGDPRRIRRRDRVPWPNTAGNRAKAVCFKEELDGCSTPQQLYAVYEKYWPGSRYHRGGRIDELLTSYLELAQSTLTPTTFRGYYNATRNFLILEFGHLHIQHLRWHHIRQFLEAEGRAQLSNKRRNNLLIPLRIICDRAVEDGEIIASPFNGKAIEGASSQHRPDPLTLAEIELLVRKAAPGFGNMIEFACFAGLRTGELIGLEWGDVDFASGYVRVQHNVAGGVSKGPKTAAGVRDVKLLARARGALTRQKSLTFLEGDRVFHDPVTSKPWAADHPIRKRWQILLKAAGVRYRRPYSTRDTYASLMLMAGEDPMWVAGQMGHKDWGVLRRTYARWIDSERVGGSRAEVMLGSPATAPAVASL